MRAFLTACLVFALMGAGTYFALNVLQNSAGAAYTQQTARTDPSWNWRVVTTELPPQPCRPRKPWQWFFLDFGYPAEEPSACSDLQ